MATTYPASLSDLRERVRRRLLTDSTKPGHWTDGMIRDALNKYQRRVQNELILRFESFYFVKRAEDLAPVNRKIDLPQDFKRLLVFEKSVGTNNGDFASIRIISPAQVREYQAPSIFNEDRPSQYQEVWAEYPRYLEAVGSSNPAGSYRLVYWHRIEDLQSDDQVTELPEDYHDLLVDGAAYQLAQDVMQTERAAVLKREYEQGVAEMRRTAGMLNVTKDMRVRDVRSHGRGRFRW